MNWQLQEAKNKLSEVVKRAGTEGPQTLTVRGERKAVIMSAQEFDSLTTGKTEPEEKKMSLLEFLQSGPEWDDEFVEMVNSRDRTPMRDIEW